MKRIGYLQDGRRKIFFFLFVTFHSTQACLSADVTPVDTLARFRQPLIRQEVLVEKYGDKIREFFKLVDKQPENSSMTGFISQFKPWLPIEKEQFFKIVELVGHRVPGLILHATHGKKIDVLRVTSLSRENSQFSKAIKLGAIGAETYGTTLILADAFFADTDYQNFGTVTHELVHVSDADRNISYSRDFLQLFGRKIYLLHQAIKDLQKENLPTTDDHFAKYFGLPTLYCGKNASECLAESFTYYVCGLSKPLPAMVAFYESSLLNEPGTADDGIADFKMGEFYHLRSSYKEAIPWFDKVIESHPKFYQACLFRGYDHLRLGEYDLALRDLDLCAPLLDELKLAPFERLYRDYFIMRAQALSLSGRETEAVAAIEKVLLAIPNDKFLVEIKARLLEGKKFDLNVPWSTVTPNI